MKIFTVCEMLMAILALSNPTQCLPHSESLISHRRSTLNAAPDSNIRTSTSLNDRLRDYWREITTICNDRSYKTCHGVDRDLWTDARMSHVSGLHFNGLGAWSTFTITTRDVRGTHRTKGGDSWYLLIRDYQQRLRLPVRVLDEGNGTYTGAVHFLHPGNYTLFGWLWYSDCHGLQEPEIKQEDHYINTLKKQDHCYIGQRLKRYSQFLIPADAPPAACMQKGCKLREGQPGMASTVIALPGLIWRMETYYYRKNHTYINAPCCKPRLGRPVGAPPIKRLLFYGDSTVKNSWDIMTYTARRPCKVAWKPRLLHELFDPSICNQKASMEEIDTEMDVILKRCTGGAPWTSVPVGVNTWDVAQYYPLSMSFNMTHFEYNDTYARNHMPPLQLPLPREFSFVYVDGWGALDYMYIKERFYYARPGDVYIINMGPHYTRTRSFQEWVRHIDSLAADLKEIMAKTSITVVWRTSFLLKEHVFRSYQHADGYVPQAHFSTEARRLLFDSYAESALQPIGVHIWDVYGICAMGDYRPNDMVHTDGQTTWAQNKDMMDLFVCYD